MLATTPENTTLARGAAIRAFASWLRHAHGAELAFPVPAAVLLDFLNQAAEGFEIHVEDGMIADGAKRQGRWSVATVVARVRHISKAHRLAGLESPAANVRIRERIAAMKRGAAQAGDTRERHDAITLGVLDQLLDTCNRETLGGLRDRGLLLFAWASGGRRRSLTAAARVEDLRSDGDEYTYTLLRSKTDQEGVGLVVPVAGRAAAALRSWLAAADIASGPIFRKVLRGGKDVGKDAIQPSPPSSREPLRSTTRPPGLRGDGMSQGDVHLKGGQKPHSVRTEKRQQAQGSSVSLETAWLKSLPFGQVEARCPDLFLMQIARLSWSAAAFSVPG